MVPDVRHVTEFPLEVVVTLRYSDVDRQGVVNNTVYGTLFEAGRADLIYNHVDIESGADFVAARLTINFIGAITWPGSVEVRTGVLKIGASSFTSWQGLYKDGVLAATCECVLVLLNWDTRKSTPIGPHLRAALGRLSVRSGASKEQEPT